MAEGRSKRASGEAIETVGDRLYSAYANLAMASASVARGIASYDALSYMVRSRLAKGLRTGAMNVGSLFDDTRKMPTDRCVYCAAVPPPALHADHLIPRHRGGPESGDNLVWACRTCNVRKSSRDMLEWYASQEQFPPLAVLRRYLKLALAESRTRGLMDVKVVDEPEVTFSLRLVPVKFPPPSGLRWLP